MISVDPCVAEVDKDLPRGRLNWHQDAVQVSNIGAFLCFLSVSLGVDLIQSAVLSQISQAIRLPKPRSHFRAEMHQGLYIWQRIYYCRNLVPLQYSSSDLPYDMLFPIWKQFPREPYGGSVTEG